MAQQLTSDHKVDLLKQIMAEVSDNLKDVKTDEDLKALTPEKLLYIRF